MPIIRHKDRPAKNGYYSKVTDSRKIITSEVGAKTFSLYEQTLPPGGYIVLHYHNYEESLTFLTGRVKIMIEDKVEEIEAETTVFIAPGVQHSIRNEGDEPARLIAVHGCDTPRVLYPDGLPEPVDWS